MAPAASLARTGRPISLRVDCGIRSIVDSNFRPHGAAPAPLVLHLDVSSDASGKRAIWRCGAADVGPPAEMGSGVGKSRYEDTRHDPRRFVCRHRRKREPVRQSRCPCSAQSGDLKLASCCLCRRSRGFASDNRDDAYRLADQVLVESRQPLRLLAAPFAAPQRQRTAKELPLRPRARSVHAVSFHSSAMQRNSRSSGQLRCDITPAVGLFHSVNRRAGPGGIGNGRRSEPCPCRLP